MIAIVMFTYARLQYASRTLAALRLLTAGGEEFWFHIADDGSPQEERDSLLAQAREIYGNNVSVTNSERSGYGGSYNQATQVVHHVADLILPLEDDWELERPLDLQPITQVLREGLFGCVRMGYIGYTQELRGKFVAGAGRQWLALDPDSPEPHVFAGGPRLETVAWQRRVGPWPEHLPAGDTEFVVAHIREAREGVAWPVDLIRPCGDAFSHIGTIDVKDAPLGVPA